MTSSNGLMSLASTKKWSRYSATSASSRPPVGSDGVPSMDSPRLKMASRMSAFLRCCSSYFGFA